jgi:hypothetical protein
MTDLANFERVACQGTSGVCSGGGPGAGGRGSVESCQTGRLNCVSGLCVLEMPAATPSD